MNFGNKKRTYKKNQGKKVDFRERKREIEEEDELTNQNFPLR